MSAEHSQREEYALSTEEQLYLSRSTGQVVRKWREHKGLTVSEFAERCVPPYNRGYISQIETGKVKNPTDAHLLRLAQGLNIPLMYLLIRRIPDDQIQERDYKSPDIPL